MTAVVRHPVLVADVLTPVTALLLSMFGTDDVPGLAPGLIVHNDADWLPATTLVDGSRLPDLLDAAQRRWQASTHAAAALAWKGYSYWLALPAVLGWASVRRVPLLHPADVLVRLADDHTQPRLGLRPSVTVAVLPTDPLARVRPPMARVVDDESALLAALRESLLDAHLAPMASAIQARAKLGSRTLRGSVSSGIAHGLLRAADSLPGSSVQDIGTVLATLGIEDLIELVPDRAGTPTVQRKTCCLAFTLPRPKICAGCCIQA
jgi:hypothetical protein